MADGRHIENRFFAISQLHIGQLMQNLDRRWRIACLEFFGNFAIHRSRDQHGNYRKFKMVDDRHIENSFISISQRWIIQFGSKLVHRCRFPFPAWTFDKLSKFCKFKMVDGRHIENRFLAISQIHFSWHVWKLDSKCRIACKQRSHVQYSHFWQFNMAAATMLKVVFLRLSIPVILIMNYKLSNVFQ